MVGISQLYDHLVLKIMGHEKVIYLKNIKTAKKRLDCTSGFFLNV